MATQSGRLLLLGGAAIAVTLALLVLAGAGLPLRAEYTGYTVSGLAPVAPEINARAPLFDLPGLDGDEVRLADLAGSPVIINFWATWCVPCRVEMPALQRVYENHMHAGLRLLAINTGESPAAVAAWRDDLGLTFDLLLDQDQQAATRYQLRGQPSTYVVSPAGIITHIFYGPVRETDLETALAPHLSQPGNAP